MKDQKFHFVFTNNKKALKQKKILLKKFKNHTLQSSNVIIVCGGDGFMLQTLIFLNLNLGLTSLISELWPLGARIG